MNNHFHTKTTYKHSVAVCLGTVHLFFDVLWKLSVQFILITGQRGVFINTDWASYEQPRVMYALRARTFTDGLKSVLCRTGLYTVSLRFHLCNVDEEC